MPGSSTGATIAAASGCEQSQHLGAAAEATGRGFGVRSRRRGSSDVLLGVVRRTLRA